MNKNWNDFFDFAKIKGLRIEKDEDYIRFAKKFGKEIDVNAAKWVQIGTLCFSTDGKITNSLREDDDFIAAGLTADDMIDILKVLTRPRTANGIDPYDAAASALFYHFQQQSKPRGDLALLKFIDNTKSYIRTLTDAQIVELVKEYDIFVFLDDVPAIRERVKKNADKYLYNNIKAVDYV